MITPFKSRWALKQNAPASTSTSPSTRETSSGETTPTQEAWNSESIDDRSTLRGTSSGETTPTQEAWNSESSDDSSTLSLKPEPRSSLSPTPEPRTPPAQYRVGVSMPDSPTPRYRVGASTPDTPTLRRASLLIRNNGKSRVSHTMVQKILLRLTEYRSLSKIC
jgi:hypothetical protein